MALAALMKSFKLLRLNLITWVEQASPRNLTRTRSQLHHHRYPYQHPSHWYLTAWYLAHAFPPSLARSLAFASFSSGSALGSATGNIIGGTLTEFTQYKILFPLALCFHQPCSWSRQTWRSSFYLLSGLVFTILLCGLYSIDPDLPSQETDKRVDWIGAFLVTTGLVLIVFVFGQGEVAPRQWATPCTC